ncbi:MAG: IS200/IS605 family transposase [Anaerolineae bacterium]|nr:IS200/IS605 family transposase [Anaerolineae bacterium]
MSYHQLFYHVAWATQNREPLLTPEAEPIVYELLRTKAVRLGAAVFALGGWVDHVHMVVSIPPTIAVAKFIGQTKAATSTRFNKGGHGSLLFWQDGYAAFTFDAKRLPNYIAYVRRQKEHHAQGTTIPLLERTAGQQTSLLIIGEEPAVYGTEDDGWRRELMELDS